MPICLSTSDVCMRSPLFVLFCSTAHVEHGVSKIKTHSLHDGLFVAPIGATLSGIVIVQGKMGAVNQTKVRETSL